MEEEPDALARRGAPRRRWRRSPRRSSPSRWCCCRSSCRSPSSPASRASCSASSRSTVSVAMLISAINALTLSPALCAVLLSPRHGPKRGPMGCVLRGIDWVRDGYAAIVARLVRLSLVGLIVLAVGHAAAPAWLSSSRRPASCRRRTRAPSSSRSSCPRAPRSTAPTTVIEQVEEIVHATCRACRTSSTIVGLSLARRPGAVEQRLLRRDAEALRRTHERRRCRPTASSIALTRRVRHDPGAIVFAFNLPPIIGLGTAGGFEYQLQNLEGRPGRDGGADARAGRRGQPGPGAGAACSPPSARTRRRSSSTSTATRRRCSASTDRRLQRAAGHAGRLLRQRLQPVRPHLAGQHAGRGGRPRRHRRHLPRQCAQPQRRDGAAARAGRR